MADEQRPSGIGWPTGEPGSTGKPWPTGKPRPAGQPRPADEPSPAEDDRSFWSLSREDQRLLWVTFIGGVASFIVGAVIIGGAIGLARVAHGAGLGFIALLTGILGLCSLIYGFFFWAWLWKVPPQERRRVRRVKGWWRLWLVYVAGVFCLVFESALILIWIGLGAGIK